MMLTKLTIKLHLLRVRKQFLAQNNISHHQYDIVVIGGGIIGTAIAKTVKHTIPSAKIALIEKEGQLGQHQSSHNSQIIHAGIHYYSGSLKSRLCTKGAALIYDYCRRKNIPTKKCGKLIIALDSPETDRLQQLYEQGLQNEVPGLELLKDWKQVSRIQPCCSGVQALWSPNSGNVDWQTVTKSFGDDFTLEGGDLFLNCQVKSIKESASSLYPVLIQETSDTKLFLAKYVVMCLGLQSGSLYENEKNVSYKNISLRVFYHTLDARLSRFIKTNIYALPHIDMPFIGIHISPTVGGSVLLGPSAVPALKVDGYKVNEIDMRYIQKNVLSTAFGLLFLKNVRSCFDQVTESVFGDARTDALSKYLPMISKRDILPGPTAVQAQVVTDDGEFVDDFIIEILEGSGIQRRIVDCRFIPSPGATCSLAIAQMITQRIEKVFK